MMVSKLWYSEVTYALREQPGGGMESVHFYSIRAYRIYIADWLIATYRKVSLDRLSLALYQHDSRYILFRIRPSNNPVFKIVRRSPLHSKGDVMSNVRRLGWMAV